jgi:hypothetical protein
MFPDGFRLPHADTCAAVAIALVGGWGIAHVYKRQRQAPLPPGPPEKSWLKGNGDEIPRTFVWLKYTEWCKKYGEPDQVSGFKLNF